jgi:hypothetical protein
MKRSFLRGVQSLLTTRNLWILIIAISVPVAIVPLSALLVTIGLCAIFLLWNTEAASLTLLDIAVFAFACSCCISTIFAEYRPAAANVLAICVSSSLIYYCVRHGLYRNTALLPVASLMSLFYAVVGLVHFITIYKQWHALSFTRLVDFRAYVTLVPSLFLNSNPDAFFVSALALSLVALCRWSTARNRVRLLFVLSSLGCFTCLLLSFSRGTYLALLCFAASYAFLARSRRYTIPAFIVGGSVLIAVALSSRDIAEAMVDTVKLYATVSQRRSFDGRMRLASESATLTLRKPLIGIGPGNFAYALQRYSLYQNTGIVGESYNLLLNTAVEGGFLGGATLLLIGVGVMMRMRDLRRTASVPSGAIVGSACVSLAVLSFSQSFLFAGRATTFYAYVLLAILAGESDPRADAI